MAVLSFVVPTILYGGAWAEVLKSVVKAVPVLVIYDRVSLEFNSIQVCHYLVKWHVATRDIARLVYFPAGPGKFVPGFNVNQKIVVIVQWFDNGKVSDNVELVFRTKLLYPLVFLAEMLYEWKVHGDNYT